MENHQRGIAQVVILLVLVAGLGSALVLSQRTQIFKPRAQEARPITVIPPYGPSPTSTLPSGLTYCRARIGDFSVSDPCDYEENGFRQVRFSCSGEIGMAGDQSVQTEGDHQTCKSIEEWVNIATSRCNSFCVNPTQPPLKPVISPPAVNPSPLPPYFYGPTPTPTLEPKPMPLFSYFCQEADEWRYTWQSCP